MTSGVAGVVGAPPPASTAQRVHFTPDAGLLDTVVDVLGNAFAFRYDSAVRIKGITRRAQAADSGWATMVYDSLSQLWTRRERISGGTVIHADSLLSDKRGKVRKNTLVGDSVGYTALGYVNYGSNIGIGATESYRLDALGVRRFGGTYGDGPKTSVYHYQPHSERLDFAFHQLSPFSDTTFYRLNADGSLAKRQRVRHARLA